MTNSMNKLSDLVSSTIKIGEFRVDGGHVFIGDRKISCKSFDIHWNVGESFSIEVELLPKDNYMQP